METHQPPNEENGGESVSAALSSKEIRNQAIQYFLTRATVEASNLMAGNPSQFVLPYRDSPQRRAKQYRPRRVVSPFEFILELVLDGQRLSYNEWFGQMQKYYQDEENRIQMMLGADEYPQIYPNGCFVYNDPTDKRWHRVRIHKLNESQRTARIFFIDLYKVDEAASLCHLYKMSEAFVDHPAPLYRCYLYDVVAKYSKDFTYASITTPWSQQACEYFQDVVLPKNKVFDGIALTRSDSLVTQGLDDVFQNIGVVLTERVKSKTSTVNIKCTVNAQMVDAGYAVPIGIFGCCQHSIQTAGAPVPSFDEDDCMKHFQSQGVTLDKEKVVNIPRGALERVFKHHTEDNGVHQGGVFSKNGYGVYDVPFISHRFFGRKGEILDPNLPESFASRLCQVRLCHSDGPGLIFLHMTNQIGALASMEACIERHALRQEPAAEDNLTPGSIIACRTLDFDSGFMNIWCRGLLISKIGGGGRNFKVFLLDYGKEATVQSHNIRTLTPYFCSVPSFSIRAHLDIPVKSGTELYKWSTQAMTAFDRQTKNYVAEDPKYYVHCRPKASQVPFEYFDQYVEYSSQQQRWIPSSCTGKTIGAVDKLKNNPLFANLFVSHGVELFYEVQVPEEKSSIWHFSTGTDVFVANNLFPKLDPDLMEPIDLKKWIHQCIFEPEEPETSISPRRKRLSTLHAQANGTEQSGKLQNDLVDVFLE